MNTDTNEGSRLTLMWGLQPPPDARIAWGARAIYKPTSDAPGYATIDLLYDRQSADALHEVTDAERKALANWIDRVGLPKLKRECRARYLTHDSMAEVVIERDGYTLKASPRASHGYLYIVVWKVTP